MLKLIKLSFKYMYRQKSRTVLTLISLILGVYLLTGIGFLVSSVIKSAHNLILEITGPYHVAFFELSKENAEKIRNNINIEDSKITLSDDIWSGIYYDDFDFNKHYPVVKINDKIINYNSEDYGIKDIDYNYIHVDTASNSFMDMYADSLFLTGHSPEKAGEVAISNILAQSANIKIGDEIKIDFLINEISPESYKDIEKIENKKKENIYFIYREVQDKLKFTGESKLIKTVKFKVTGITDYAGNAYFIQHESEKQFDSDKLNYNLNAKLHKNIGNDLTELCKKMLESVSIKVENEENRQFQFNDELLMIEGRGEEFMILFSSAFAVISLIFIFFFFVVRLIIDNAFELSTQERIRQFGVLRTIGASKFQIRFVIFIEALVLAVIAGSIGLTMAFFSAKIAVNEIVKLGGIYIDDLGKNFSFENFEVSFMWKIMIPIIAISIYGIFISAYTSVMKIVKVSPAETIKYGRPSQNKIKNHKNKLFGFSYNFALKNIKRNKLQYILSVFSMTIGFVIFIFSFSVSINTKEVKFTDREFQGDIKISFMDDTDYKKGYEYLEAIKPYLKEIQYEKRIGFNLKTENKDYQKYMTKKAIEQNTFNHDLTPILISTISRENFHKLKVDMSYDEFLESDGILISESSSYINAKENANPYQNIITYKMISDIDYLKGSYQIAESKNDINIVGMYSTDEVLLLSSNYTYKAVIAEKNFEKIENYSNGDYKDFTQFSVKIIDENYDEIINILSLLEDELNNFIYQDNFKDIKVLNTTSKIINIVLTYILLILVGVFVVNFINTIITGITNRKRDYFMLRACGMNKKQLAKAIFTEGMLMMLNSIIVSSILSTIFVNGFLFLSIYYYGGKIYIPIVPVIIAVVFAILVVFMSSIGYISKISKTPISEGIRVFD